MLRLEGKYFPKEFTYTVWLLMAFQAGYVNVGGFFTSGNFVSHVTGTSSNIGMGIGNWNMVVLATFATVLLSFIGGAAFSGHFIGRKIEEKKDPEYILVLGTKSLFFFMVLLLSTLNLPQSGWLSSSQVNLFIIFFLSFCCGVQNSTCSLATDGFLKPTHMTGLSTDLGIGLTRIFSWNKSSDKFKDERTKLLLRIGILISFIFGGVISTVIFQHNGVYGFLYPFLSSLCFLALGIIRKIKKFEGGGFAIHTAQMSLVATFALTLIFGIRAYAEIQ